jgi:hypothetical protein
MKVRTAVLGIAIVAFIAGGYLGGLFPQWGKGSGTGNGDGKPESATHEKRDQNAQSSDPSIIDDSRIVQVKIDDRNYQMARPGHKPLAYNAVVLEEIVAAARSAKGNNRGIKVRVARTPTSRSSAEHALRDALEEAGVGKDAIEWLDGPEP